MNVLVLACGIPAVAMIWAIGISFALLDSIIGYVEHVCAPAVPSAHARAERELHHAVQEITAHAPLH